MIFLRICNSRAPLDALAARGMRFTSGTHGEWPAKQSAQERRQDVNAPFNIQVGNGSDRHCLLGSARTISATSVGVTGVKRRSSRPSGAGVYWAAGASAVAARTPATLSSKNWCRMDASVSADSTEPRPSSWSNDRHKRCGCDWSAVMRAVQNSDLRRCTRLK